MEYYDNINIGKGPSEPIRPGILETQPNSVPPDTQVPHLPIKPSTSLSSGSVGDPQAPAAAPAWRTRRGLASRLRWNEERLEQKRQSQERIRLENWRAPSSEPTKIEPLQADPPQVNPPRTDPPRIEPLKFDHPQIESPQIGSPQIEPPKSDHIQADPPQLEPLSVQPPPIKSPQIKPSQSDLPHISGVHKRRCSPVPSILSPATDDNLSGEDQEAPKESAGIQESLLGRDEEDSLVLLPDSSYFELGHATPLEIPIEESKRHLEPSTGAQELSPDAHGLAPANTEVEVKENTIPGLIENREEMNEPQAFQREAAQTESGPPDERPRLLQYFYQTFPPYGHGFPNFYCRPACDLSRMYIDRYLMDDDGDSAAAWWKNHYRDCIDWYTAPKRFSDSIELITCTL